MTRAEPLAMEGRHRASGELPGERGQIAASDLLAFGERLVRGAAGASAANRFSISSATLHLLGGGGSNKVVGEAVQLSRDGPPVWRVSVSDKTGRVLAEMTLTVSAEQEAGGKNTADVVPMATATGLGPEGRRAQIARAARDVFAEKGFAAATMREVAAAAGMHVPTMYQYFRSKEEILELVYDWTINKAVDEMQPVLDADGPPEEKIETIVRKLHEVNLKLRRGTLVMNRETRSLSPQARQRVLGRYATMVRRLGGVIAEGQASDRFRDVDPELAAVFVDALADLWVLRPFAVNHMNIEEYVIELVAFVRGALERCPTTTPDQPDV